MTNVTIVEVSITCSFNFLRYFSIQLTIVYFSSCIAQSSIYKLQKYRDTYCIEEILATNTSRNVNHCCHVKLDDNRIHETDR